MDPPPPSSPLPPLPIPKLRLMCSYNGQILPRPHDKSLFYASGETRIISLDRRTTALSLSSLTSHLSSTLFNNRTFHLKYQLPDQDLDSLISVITDEDLANMIEEHDRIIPPARIRLFLFPVKSEPLDSKLMLDSKSESWFSDALKNSKIVGGGPESVFLETSSSFGSTSSSLSNSNSPPVVVDGKGVNLVEDKIRVPSSASIESESSVGSLTKTGISQEPPLIQVASSEAPLFHIESENTTISDPSFTVPTQKTVQVLGYPSLSHLPDGNNNLQYDTQVIQGGGLQYAPPQYHQFPPYYPVYQMPMHPPNQSYPVYLMPITPPQYHNNMPMQFNPSIDTNTTTTSSRPPLHPQATITQIVEPTTTKAYIPASTTTTHPNMPSNQVQLVVGPTEAQIAAETVTSEFEDDIAYNQIYKSQPSAPILPTQYHGMTTGTTVMLPEPCTVQIHTNHA